MSRKLYIGNAFSVNMIKEGRASADFYRITPEEARREIEEASNVECVIGHESTARIAEELLGVKLNCQRKAIKLEDGDILIAITLAFRPEEGKVYSEEELKEFLEEGKIAIWLIEMTYR